MFEVDEVRFTFLVFFFLFFIFVVFIISFITLFRRRQNELLLKNQLDEEKFRNDLLEKELEANKKLERERERISLDIHDDLGASLSAIKLKAEFIRSKSQDNQLQSDLSDIVENAAEVAFNMREMMWSLTSENDTLENFIIYIRNYIVEYFQPTQIQLHIDIPVLFDNFAMSGYTRRNLFLCVKEGCHNILKHSAANNVNLSFSLHNRILTLILADDGIGLSDENRKGNGLYSMQKRIDNIGGTISINSQQGTKIVWKLPI